MKKMVSLLIFASILLMATVISAKSLPLDPSLSSWIKYTLPADHYVNMAQISTPYGNGISVDTIGYPGAYEWNYDFFAYYKQIFVVPSNGIVEIKGYFFYNDTVPEGYVPNRKFLAVYLLSLNLSAYIGSPIHILDKELFGDLPGVWYNRRIIISNMTPGQQYRIAFGRSDLCDTCRKLKASWASVQVGPPVILKIPEDYATIQEAVSETIDGDIIQVSSGLHLENIVVNKTISLIGENKFSTILDGGKIAPTIEILAGEVSIYGFTIRNGSILLKATNSNIEGNIISGSQCGILISESSGNTIVDNIISNNDVGIKLLSNSSENAVCRNSFINNTQNVLIDSSSSAIWDDGIGNYWSDYNGTDSNTDGIGDTPYIIDENNQDNYPLMKPYLKGDINHDRVVNILDLVKVASKFGTNPASPGWNPLCDLNRDNVVNILDLVITSANFGKKWQPP